MSVDTNPREATTMKVWNVFYAVMQEMHGHGDRQKGEGAFTHKYRHSFDAIAVWCIAHEVDPEDYIRVTAKLLSDTGKRLLKPTDFEAEARYAYYLKMKQGNEGGEPQLRWSIQATHLQTMVARAPDLYPNALDPLIVFDTPFDPWFRVAYPPEAIPQIVTIFGELAWDDLSHNGALRRYIRQVRPNTLQLLEQQFGSFVD
jgi:hypothetical protein